MSVQESVHGSQVALRRQFVASTSEVPTRPTWRQHTMNSVGLMVQAHPDLPVDGFSADNVEITLVGYAFDPHLPDAGTTDLLHSIARERTIGAVAAATANWAGRFILLIAVAGRLYILTDPCGFRSVYYMRSEGEVHIASQPTSLPGHEELPLSEIGKAFEGSAYARSHEPWLPSGTSLRSGVRHLVPNHYLDVTTLEQVRFWPVEVLARTSTASAVERSAAELSLVLAAAARRFPLAVPVTAGWDSRLLLAATVDMPDVYYYTLLYRDLTSSNPDIAVPADMLRHLGFTHHVLECRGAAPAAFLTAAQGDVPLASDDLSSIAYGLTQEFPSERVALKGNASEIAREFYPDFLGPITASKLAVAAQGWAALPSFVASIDQWLVGARAASQATGWRVLDLFYWEHRMGSWQARSQAEWDVAQETFTPYNYRPLLSAMMGATPRLRRGRRNRFYERLIAYYRPSLTTWPINPVPRKDAASEALRDGLRNVHVLGEVQYRVHELRSRRGPAEAR